MMRSTCRTPCLILSPIRRGIRLDPEAAMHVRGTLNRRLQEVVDLGHQDYGRARFRKITGGAKPTQVPHGLRRRVGAHHHHKRRRLQLQKALEHKGTVSVG